MVTARGVKSGFSTEKQKKAATRLLWTVEDKLVMSRGWC